METAVVRARMQFERGFFQEGWEQSEAPKHPILHYKEGTQQRHHYFGVVH
jgi:hypothetical protein